MNIFVYFPSEIYLFGGFSAVVKKDLYKIVAGRYHVLLSLF